MGSILGRMQIHAAPDDLPPPFPEPAVEDFRSDRQILEAVSAELERQGRLIGDLVKLVEKYEPHARKLVENPLARLLRARQGAMGNHRGA